MFKKLIFTGLGMALCASTVLADRSTYDETKTRIAYPLAEPPVIDGVIDAGNGESWNRAGGAHGGSGDSHWFTSLDLNLDDEVRGAAVAVGDSPLDDADLSFQMYAGYDSEYLYVAVRVSDDFLESDSATAGSQNEQTWHDDSVEVFVDGDNSNFPDSDGGGSRPEGNSTGGQYVITVNNAYREAEAGDPGYGPDASWYALTSITDSGYDAVSETATGYQVEFKVTKFALHDPPDGTTLGFHIALNDDDGNGRQAQTGWNGRAHSEWTYGTLTLSAEGGGGTTIREWSLY